MKLYEFWYGINNGGDGSVSMQFYESKKLAQWTQENDMFDEGWVEDCSSCVIIKSETPPTLIDNVVTIKDHLAELEAHTKWGCDHAQKLLAKFMFDFKEELM